MRSVLILMTFLVSSLAFTQSLAQSTVSIDAGRGDIPLHVPTNYAVNTPAPLVVLLHGYGSNGAQQEGYMGFSALVDRFGFLLATPDGTQEAGGRNSRFWNASEACCNFFRSDLDDSAYVLAIINTVKAAYQVDERRIYLIGHSNGGFMSYKAAHDHSDVIAGIASLAGAEATVALPAPANPVHVLQIHGTADGTIAYEGGDIQGTTYPSAEQTIARWVDYNGCSAQASVPAMLDLDLSIEGLDTTVARYSADCLPGGSVELWTINEGAHIPAISSSFSENVIEWLLSRAKIVDGGSVSLSAD
jgi:polyhydroxybutyrate depolymerase